MFALFTLLTFAATQLPYGFEAERMVPMGILLGIMSTVLLRTQPPQVGTVYNHVVLAGVYVGTALAMIAFHPVGSAPMGAAMFIGPLTASRLIERSHIAAHFTAATVCLLLPSVLGLVDTSAMLTGLTVIPALWVLGACSAVVLEVAEAQGEELEQLVRRDPLTGVGNRRLLAERLPEELSRHARSKRPLSIVALDLNGFKALNDNVGHAAGDDLLQQVARALDQVSRHEDLVVRQGGDEFCVVLAETSAQAADRVAGAIVRAISQIQVDGHAVSTGIGIASYPDDAIVLEELLRVADDRLRDDKLNARPVLWSTTETPEPLPGGDAGDSLAVYREAQ